MGDDVWAIRRGFIQLHSEGSLGHDFLCSQREVRSANFFRGQDTQFLATEDEYQSYKFLLEMKALRSEREKVASVEEWREWG